ncbi:hypothetical protein D3C83_78840 [compost metagenome]
MLLAENFLLLHEILQLQIEVAGARVLARVQAVHFDAQVGDAVFVGRQQGVVLAAEQPCDVGAHQQRQ